MTHHEKHAKDEAAVVVTRVFDAPRESVYKAWTDPQLISQWFAPEPLTVPKAEMDVRPGGNYTIVMRDQDGNEFPTTGVYKEVVEPQRLVYTDSVAEMPQDFIDQVNEVRGAAKGTPLEDGTVTVTFEDAGNGRSKVTFRAEYDSKATADAWRQMQMVEGLEASFDNLERVLAKTPAVR